MLAVGEVQPLGAELQAQHAVLLAEALDRSELSSVHPTRDGEKEEVKSGGLHEVPKYHDCSA